jgi:short-subunit dehydrogenase
LVEHNTFNVGALGSSPSGITTALNKTGDVHGETPMDEGKMMSSEDCAQHILKAIRKKKRTLVLTFTGKRTVFWKNFFLS